MSRWFLGTLAAAHSEHFLAHEQLCAQTSAASDYELSEVSLSDVPLGPVGPTNGWDSSPDPLMPYNESIGDAPETLWNTFTELSVRHMLPSPDVKWINMWEGESGLHVQRSHQAISTYFIPHIDANEGPSFGPSMVPVRQACTFQVDSAILPAWIHPDAYFYATFTDLCTIDIIEGDSAQCINRCWKAGWTEETGTVFTVDYQYAEQGFFAGSARRAVLVREGELILVTFGTNAQSIEIKHWDANEEFPVYHATFWTSFQEKDYIVLAGRPDQNGWDAEGNPSIKQPMRTLQLPDLKAVVRDGGDYIFDGTIHSLTGPPVSGVPFVFAGGYNSKNEGVWIFFQNPEDLEDIMSVNVFQEKLGLDPDMGAFAPLGKYIVGVDLSSGYLIASSLGEELLYVESKGTQTLDWAFNQEMVAFVSETGSIDVVCLGNKPELIFRHSLRERKILGAELHEAPTWNVGEFHAHLVLVHESRDDKSTAVIAEVVLPFIFDAHGNILRPWKGNQVDPYAPDEPASGDSDETTPRPTAAPQPQRFTRANPTLLFAGIALLIASAALLGWDWWASRGQQAQPR